MKDLIEKARWENNEIPRIESEHYVFTESELHELLTKVAEAQREADCNSQCLGYDPGVESYEWDTEAVERINNTPLVSFDS